MAEKYSGEREPLQAGAEVVWSAARATGKLSTVKGIVNRQHSRMLYLQRVT